MVDLLIIKKDGCREPFNLEFAHTAVEHSAACVRGLRIVGSEINETIFQNGTHLSDEEWKVFDEELLSALLETGKISVTTEVLHQLVIRALERVSPSIASSYKEFHCEKLQFKKALSEALAEREHVSSDLSNANADAGLSSTIKVLSGEYFEKSANRAQLMTQQDRDAVDEGAIYWHDLGSLRAYTHNCCVFSAADILSHPFSINGVTYQTPKSLSEALSTCADVIFCIASNQYGGCTCARVDSMIAPYAEEEYQQRITYLKSLGLSQTVAERAACEHVLDTIKAGYTRWEILFNTVGSSRGDFPFITITGGADATRFSYPWAALFWNIVLEVRRTGHGEDSKKRPVLFPKIVFLYDESLHGKNRELEWLFENAIECSSVTMYPDYLSLTGEGYVPDMYKKYGTIISPMGCRAFLSPWYRDGGMEPDGDSDVPVFEGRFNIGVISLNLPLIYGQSKESGMFFLDLLDYYLELIRRAFKRRYRQIGQMKASRNPLLFMEGGAYNPDTKRPAKLNADDTIKPLLKCATASFGITALNELQMFYNGKSLVEDGAFALEVMEHISKKIEEYKKEDGHLYAIYGTPAEKLCGLQAEQLKDHFGIIPGVSDRAYVSNSFHCHVTEQITPFQKQDLEKRFWNFFNGGKIQYVKYPLRYNVGAIRSLVHRAMDLGFYEGVNLSLSFCADCGTKFGDIGGDCPCCHSPNIFSINRMNGYLGFSRQGSTSQAWYDSKQHSRFNIPKQIEISERISM